MKYISTRGEAPAQSFCDILLGGLAPDGGLSRPNSRNGAACLTTRWP
jgi:threonine synthase